LNKQDESDESGEDYEGNINSNTGNEGKYTVVSKHSLPIATSCLVGILDKAYIEVDSLMKLRNKLRVKTKKRIKSVGNQDGHISSDDEEDANGNIIIIFLIYKKYLIIILFNLI
jgi:hypothetical protein